MSEARVEGAQSPQATGLKVLESLKRHFFGHTDSPSKPLSGREICSSFCDLTDAVFSASQRANSGMVVSGAIELLVHACASQDRGIRLAAQENLHKLVKGLQSTHLSRLQQDLFHELKKNGSARALGVALEVFAALFPSTRPSRRQSLSQALFPVLLRLLGREEEGLHEALRDAVSLILPTMTPFLSATNIRLMMSALLEHMPDSPASFRRMAASTLHSLTTHTRSPEAHTHWLACQLLTLGCLDNATEQMCQGILLTLQNMISGCRDNFNFETQKNVYGFVLSCILYRDGNTAVAATETMHTLLLSPPSSLSHWLTASHPHAAMATRYWLEPVSGEREGERKQVRAGGEEQGGQGEGQGRGLVEREDTPSTEPHSLGEGLNDGYFDSDHESSPIATEPPTSSDVAAAVPSDPGPFPQQCCLAVCGGPKQPLASLVQYLQEEVLPSSRVSVVSVGLACLAAAVELSPPLLPSLSPYLPFTVHPDPKLKSRSAKLLAVLLRALLRESRGDCRAAGPLVATAATALQDLLSDGTPVVLKAVCESLRLCLPALATSSQPQLAVSLVQQLLSSRSSSYWLAKVELLRTLACLPLTALALSLPSLPHSLLSLAVFPLLGDSDHRVRTAATEAIVLLVPCLQLTSDPVLAHARWEVSREFPSPYSHAPQLSLASVGLHGSKTRPPSPLGLGHMLWFLLGNISSSESRSLQRGCLEALYALCQAFPPPCLPGPWGCELPSPSLLPTSLSLLTASHLACTVQGHQWLLDVTSSLFLACSLSAMTRCAQSGQATSGPGWAALGDADLAGHAASLLRHTARLLALFSHVVEGREPESREIKRIPMVSPKKAAGREASPVRSSPKPKVLIIENLQKPPLVPRDGIGQFASLHHYLKIMDACRSAYTNYQVSLSGVGEDKFSRLLQSTHNMAATLLEVALAADVGKHVEELMTYFTFTFRVDPSGALLCVQQLLNALFGMNAAAQHTFLHSPYLSSLNFDLSPLHTTTSPLPPHSASLTQVTLSQPLGALEAWLEAPPPHPHLSPSNPSPPLPRKRSLLPSRRALVVKPVNSVSSVKDYIGHFEPLVVNVVKRFPHTSSHLLQQRTLFLLVQLLQLKVRYELLDCNHTFLESVLRLVGLMESGVVRDGEDLVPFLFQFLVLLAYDNSQLVSVPEVMQRCDGVMASGHSVDTFAIPALQPLVLNLFVRPGREGAELATQREVVLSMLLRVVEHQRVLSLLTHVLDCFSRSAQHWHRVSSQILASLLNAVGRLSLVLDSADSLASLYHLFSAMDPSAISMKAVFVAVLKQPVLSSVGQLCRWLAVLNSALTLSLTLFPDSTLYSELSCLTLAVPGVRSEEVEVVGEPPCHPLTEDTPVRLAWFLLGVLRVAVETEQQLVVQPGAHPQPLLPQLLGRCLLLLSSLVSGPYESLRAALSNLRPPASLAPAFLSLASSHPLLTMHYSHLALLTGSHSWVLSVLKESSISHSPSHLLLHRCLLPLVTSPADSVLAAALAQHTHSTIADPQQVEVLLGQLMTSDLCSLGACVRALQVARRVGSVAALSLLCSRLVPHPLSAISLPASRLALHLLAENDVSAEIASQLLALLGPHGDRCPELLAEVQKLGGLSSPPSSPLPPPSSHPLQSTVTVQTVTKLWYLSEVFDMCAGCREPWLCGRVLSRLSQPQLEELMDSTDFSKGLLEASMCRGLELSLSRDPSSLDSDYLATPLQGPIPHPLLQVSSSCLLQRLVRDPSDNSLLPALLWLLVARQQMPAAFPLDMPTSVAIATLVRNCLEEACGGCHSNTVGLQVAVDCLALSLAVPEVQSAVGEEWVVAVVPCVAGLLEEEGSSAANSMAKEHSPSQLLHSALTRYLQGRLRPPLGLHVGTALLWLARLPAVHPPCLIPPLLLSQPGPPSLSEQALDQALLEGEVLQQYMSRSNCIGWLSRPQFEERWMQLLGVVNQPPPSEGMPVEELHAYTLNMCIGVVGVVSLLLATSLRPQPGNPVAAVTMHTHRNRDVLFLGTNPGRRLSMVRRVVERQLLLQCGARPDLCSHYQHPLVVHLSPVLPPLFTRNVERGPGDTGLGPGQLSLKSLWPVTLMSATSTTRYTAEAVDVDVRSCVLSLVDLFSHWLSQPLHCVLLLHTLRAVLMLSDLFAVASQFEWMLQMACELSESQPPEDTSAHSLLVHCLLKAAAVLKVEGQQQVEKVVRAAEKALAVDSLQVQNGCLQGLLYVAEDPSSQLMAQLGPSLVRYLPPQLEAFHRHTELHCRLAWSLAVSLALHHSHHLREPEFPGLLLERAIPLLLHPHTSSLLFHCISLGLELLVCNFTFSAGQRAKVSSIAASRCLKCEQDKLLPALGLLVSCMYTGQASAMSAAGEDTTEAAVQTREHVSMLMELLRHGSLEGVRFLVDVVPVLLVDFLPPLQVLQVVVTEFVSPHQPRPTLAAIVMGETFSLLLGQNLADLVTDWVLLSMDSFVQQEPESKAVWCLACLLTAASSSPILQAMLEIVADQPDMPLPQVRALLATATSHFYRSQASPQQREVLVQKLQTSQYPTLNAIAHTCLHS